MRHAIWLLTAVGSVLNSSIDSQWLVNSTLPFASQVSVNCLLSLHAAHQPSTVIKLQDNSGDHEYSSGHRRRRLVQTTRKLDCPAKVYIKEIVHFPSFKVKLFPLLHNA